jgi:hypothetical protein
MCLPHETKQQLDRTATAWRRCAPHGGHSRERGWVLSAAGRHSARADTGAARRLAWERADRRGIDLYEARSLRAIIPASDGSQENGIGSIDCLVSSRDPAAATTKGSVTPHVSRICAP